MTRGPHTRVALVAVALLAAGCASLTGSVGAACAELTGQLLCGAAQSFCSDDGTGDDDIVEEDPAVASARRLAEAPPPAWEPAPGREACEAVREGDVVRMSCADGTRARFRVPATERARAPLILEEDTTPGDGCVGRARVQGYDDDNDGVLSPLELRGRVVLCDSERDIASPTLRGDLALLTEDDVLLLAARRAVTGSVLLSGDTLVDLTLPSLRTIGGSLRAAQAPALERVALSALAHVGGDVAFDGLPALKDIEAPALELVGGSVVLTDNARLTQDVVERFVVTLARRGFGGPVIAGGNAR